MMIIKDKYKIMHKLQLYYKDKWIYYINKMNNYIELIKKILI